MSSWYVQGSAGSDNNGGTSWTVHSTDTDGVTAGTNTLTSVAAKFVAGDVGHGIFIGGVNQWRLITAFTSATSITFSGATIAAGSGRTWTIGGRFATVSKALAIAGLAAGDKIYTAPGTYRELLTISVSGGNAYTTGTVSLTNGSAVVTGSGTSWLANAFVGGHFQVTQIAHGTDGATTAGTATTATFTSAAGNFQASMVGLTLRLTTVGCYIITAVASATSITIALVDNSSFSTTNLTGLTYDVGPESPYDIASLDSNTQITLSAAWSGPTLTGLAYTTWNPIRLIGDYTGVNTDGVGGVVRITGSNDDLTATRGNCITVTSKSYNTVSGLLMDLTTTQLIALTTSDHIIVDKCVCKDTGTTIGAFISSGATCTQNTIQNCFIAPASGGNQAMQFTHTSTANDMAILVQNCVFLTGGTGIRVDRLGGILVRNCTFLASTQHIFVQIALATGQCMTVNNCTFTGSAGGVRVATAQDLIEDYNDFFGIQIARNGVLVGPHSNLRPQLYDARWFFQMVFAGAGPNSPAQVVSPFDLASYSQLLNVAGFNPPLTDLRGTAVQGAQREWGAVEYDSTLKILGGVHKSRVRTGY